MTEGHKEIHKSLFMNCLTLALFLGLSYASKSQISPVSRTKNDTASISFRLGIGQTLSAERFNGVLDYFDKYSGLTNEITFFTSATHPPIPLETLRQRVVIFKERMAQARKRGFMAGINVLSTIGHMNENLDNSLRGNYTHMTDIAGLTSEGIYCPNDERFRKEYIREVYKASAQAQPDYIWIDDDVRMIGYGPIRNACFCDNCLHIFSQEYGTTYTRETLKKALDEGPVVDKLQLRKNWVQHNGNTIANLLILIEKTVHEVNPKISLGFMSTYLLFYAGYDFENWAKILSGPNKIPVKWRPGGGAYDDYAPGAFISKAHTLGMQVSALPKEVVSIQSEIENFPYLRLKKSASMVAFEAATYIASGCTGTAYNVLSFYDEPLEEYEPLADVLWQNRPFLDLMTKHLGRIPIVGAFSYWNRNSEIAGNPVEGSWFNASPPLNPYDMYELGIPASYQKKNSAVTLIGKDMVYAMSKEEIKLILSGGVYMDAEALKQLNSMGYADLTGFEVINEEYKDRIEKLAEDPLNGRFVGRWRDNRQSAWMVPAFTLKKTDEKARILSELIDYREKIVGECSMGIYENSLGGRICVSGYYPWTSMGNLAKTSQLKSVFRWLSKDKLPGYIDSFHKINLWIREQNDNKISLAFTNSSFDAAKDVHLMLLTKNTSIKVYNMECKETVIKSSGNNGPYQRFVIPLVEAWQVMLVINE